MKKFWMTGSLPLILVSLSYGCAPAEETVSEESAQALTSRDARDAARDARDAARDARDMAKTAARKARDAAKAGANALRKPYDGTIVAVRLVEQVPVPMTMVVPQIYDGPLPEQSCKFKTIDGCELQTCDDDDVVPGSGALTNVGTISIEGESVHASASPNAQGTYDTLTIFDSLWNNPRDRVNISYTNPKGGTVRTNQIVPASDLTITEAVPSVVQQGQPTRVAWTGAKPGNGGEVVIMLTSEEGTEVAGGGSVKRTHLTCSASPLAGQKTISARATARLQAGSYRMLVQAMSQTEDKLGVNHILMSLPKNYFSTFTVQ